MSDLIRNAVAVANSVIMGLGIPVGVTFERSTAPGDEYTGNTYAAPVTLQAVVDWAQKQLRTKEGALTVSRAHLIFTDVDALKAATAGNGIQDEDRITLPDGTTGPIIDMGGFLDRATGRPFATEVWLG